MQPPTEAEINWEYAVSVEAPLPGDVVASSSSPAVGGSGSSDVVLQPRPQSLASVDPDGYVTSNENGQCIGALSKMAMRVS